MNTQSLIQQFFNTKRFAIIGVSRDPKDFSRTLFKEFLTRGYDVLPVNPFIQQVEQRRCYSHLNEIEPGVSAALVMTPAIGSELIIRECIDAGIRLIWLYGISGMKNVNPNAVELCKENGIEAIPGYCPFMFLPSTPWFHRVHGVVWKLLGKYPL